MKQAPSSQIDQNGGAGEGGYANSKSPDYRSTSWVWNDRA